MTNSQVLAQEIEQAIDLTKQLDGLGEVDENAVIIQMMPNPQRNKVTLWSMEDGEPVKVPFYRVRNMLTKTDENGNRRFTTHKEDAPEPVVGTFKCFLAADSEERLSGEVDEAGLQAAVKCKYVHGPSEFAKHEHERKKHISSWPVWQAYQAKKEQDEIREETRQMQQAMLALAQSSANSRGSDWLDAMNGPVGEAYVKTAAAVAVATAEGLIPMTCECGWITKPDSKNPAASLNTHKRLHCKLNKE